MPDEIFLTPTDVAEALGCPMTEVLSLIEGGRLPATRSRGWKIAHDELATFISESRIEALELGHAISLAPSFSISRPLE
jgi:excisionase family DNA binding protein